MSATEPIRNKQALNNFKNYYVHVEPNLRNYALIIVGLNTALRINDLLHLKWDEIFWNGEIKEHLYVLERKTQKINRIYVNEEAKKVLALLRSSFPSENPYVFGGTKSNSEPISRQQAYRIIKKAAENVGLTEHISCHSLRKTFGYHAWKQGTQPALLMSIYNHSSYEITMRYLCIAQDDKDKVFCNINL